MQKPRAAVRGVFRFFTSQGSFAIGAGCYARQGMLIFAACFFTSRGSFGMGASFNARHGAADLRRLRSALGRQKRGPRKIEDFLGKGGIARKMKPRFAPRSAANPQGRIPTRPAWRCGSPNKLSALGEHKRGHRKTEVLWNMRNRSEFSKRIPIHPTDPDAQRRDHPEFRKLFSKSEIV